MGVAMKIDTLTPDTYSTLTQLYYVAQPPLPLPSQLIWNTVRYRTLFVYALKAEGIDRRGALNTLSSLSLKFRSEFICATARIDKNLRRIFI